MEKSYHLHLFNYLIQILYVEPRKCAGLVLCSRDISLKGRYQPGGVYILEAEVEKLQ
jgi:hypothetical protein